MSIELHFNHQHLLAEPGLSLFDCAETLAIHVPTSCRKQGKCKECLVEVTEGLEFLSPRTPEESHLHERFRLSCRCQLVQPAGVVRCHTLRRGALQIETAASGLPSLPPTFTPDPAVTRRGDRILLDGQDIEQSTGPLHGLAMDLGTTTVVLRLLNLETGATVASTSFENPQRFGGSDVMARIHYDTQHPGRLLQRTLLGYLAHAIEEFPVDPRSIYELVVAGNSTMRDLFFGLDVHSIGQNPYQSLTELELAAGTRSTTSLHTTAQRLRLPLHPKARVYGLPIISGHVGADAAACLLAVDLAHQDQLVAVMDIGTNTELLLGHRHKIYAASCPAGPAFEGGRIACGMPGLPGAIEDLTLLPDASAQIRVIGSLPPEGLCGSGLVALLSELLRTRQLNPLGRFENDQDRFVIPVPSDEPVFLSESDINELAQAKGANIAGLRILFESFGARFHDLHRFYLAGGFGRHLDLDAARRIGLIPDLPSDRIVQVGNAAIEGASLALLSQTKRQELELLVRRVTHCRLEADPNFFDHFVEGCQFQRLHSPP